MEAEEMFQKNPVLFDMMKKMVDEQVKQQVDEKLKDVKGNGGEIDKQNGKSRTN